MGHSVVVGAGDDDVMPFGDFFFEGFGLLAVMFQRITRLTAAGPRGGFSRTRTGPRWRWK
jgi:hypothetical protein